MESKRKELSVREFALYILLLIVGLGTVILAVNEVTWDSYDRIGSNYWLSYFAIGSGIVTFGLALWLIKFRAKTSLTIREAIPENPNRNKTRA